MIACCCCGDTTLLLAPKNEGCELKRGLVHMGQNKWLCADCTRTANGEFARRVNVARDADAPASRDEPPPGFA